MLWKKSAVVPIKGEPHDFLEELARQSGEEKQQVQTLLEDYARQRDRVPERKWSTVPKSAAPDPRIDELSKRLAVMEEGMSSIIDTVTAMKRQLASAKPTPDREATARVLESLTQLIASLRQANGI